MKRPTRKSLVAKLDKLFSMFIRLRDKRVFKGICPLCGTRPQECVFHFITRSKHSIRWDPRNGVASCFADNIRYEHDQTFVEKVFTWYKLRHGEQAWEDLKRDGNRIAKHDISDLRDIKAVLEKLTQEVCK